MKKLILLSISVMCLNFVQAQTITKISGRYMATNYPDLNGAIIYHQQRYINNVSLILSVEYTNGPNALENGDIVIIAGEFTRVPFDFDDITIGEDSYKGAIFEVKGSLAAGAPCVFEIGSMSISSSGTTEIDEVTQEGIVRAKCIYTSADGNLKNASLPEKVATFTLVNTSSISESAVAAVKIFPTLVSNELQVTNLKNTDVSIYSLVGQQIAAYSDLTGNTSIGVNTFPNGIYFVKIQNGNSIRTEKIRIVR